MARFPVAAALLVLSLWVSMANAAAVRGGVGLFSARTTWTPQAPLAGDNVVIDASQSCSSTTAGRAPHVIDVVSESLGAVVVESTLNCPALVRITGELRAASLLIRGPAVVLLDSASARITLTGDMTVLAPAVLMGAGVVSARTFNSTGRLAAGASLKGACPSCYPLGTQKIGLLSIVTTGLATVSGPLYAKLDSVSTFYDPTVTHDTFSFTNVAFKSASLSVSLSTAKNAPTTPVVKWKSLGAGSVPLQVAAAPITWPWVAPCWASGLCAAGGGCTAGGGVGGLRACSVSGGLLSDPGGSAGAPPGVCSTPSDTSVLISVGTCSSTVIGSASFTSSCAPGYSGNPCTADCLSAPQCNDHGSCITGATSQCACTSSNGFGWTGLRCDVPFCPNDCNNGVCQAGPIPQCVCSSGYGGTACDVAQCPGGCGNGTCFGGTGTPTCNCNIGWTGPGCQTAVVGCPPCQNGGTCNDTAGERVCACPMGQWEGNECQLALCPGFASGSTSNCNGKGTCNTLVTPHVCQCASGYEGDACEIRASVTTVAVSGGESLPTWAIAVIVVVACVIVGGLVAATVVMVQRTRTASRNSSLRRQFVAREADYVALQPQ